MVPVKDMKEVISFLGSGLAVYKAANADGKIDAGDLGHLMLLIPTAGPAFEGLGNLGEEFTDISTDERAELDAHIDQVFGSGKASEIGEDLLQMIVRVGRILTVVKAEAPTAEA